MRITNGMLVNNMMNNLNANLNRMAKYQNQGASGRLFDRPSDNPIGMSRSLKLYTDISRVNQYERNLNDANSWMHTTEEALKELEQILQRTRELSVDAANGTKTEEDTKNIAEEIKQLKEQAIKLANTRHAGRSIFTGFKTDKDLLQSNGTYNIVLNKGDISNYNVGISEDIDVNIVGSRVFGFAKNDNILESNLKGDLIIDEDNDSQETKDIKKRKLENLNIIKNKLKQAGIDDATVNAMNSYGDLPKLSEPPTLDEKENVGKIEEFLGITKGKSTPDELWFNILNEHGELSSSENDESSMMNMFDKLVAAMEKGDHEQVDKYLDDIDIQHKNIISIKSEIGAKTNRLDMTEKRLSAEKLNFRDNLSKNEDVDYAELIMKSNIAQTIYQASLSISGRVIQPSLLDFLR